MSVLLNRLKKIAEEYRSPREPKLYNALILDNYIQLLRNKYTEVDINKILEGAGIQAWEVSDPGQWFTQSQVNRFYEQISKACKPKTEVSIAREAGRFAASEKSKKVMRQAALSLISPAQVYDIVGKLALKYTRHAIVNVRTISKTCREITMTFKKGVHPSPHQCDNTIGSLEANTLMFWNKLPNIEHPECYFQGADHCRYIVSWDTPPSEAIRLTRNYVTGAGILVAIGAYALGFAKIALSAAFFLPLIGIFLSFIAERREKQEIVQSYRGMDFKPDDYLISHSKYYNTAQLVGEISKHLARNTSTHHIVVKLGQILTGLGFTRGMIFFVSHGAPNMAIELAYEYDTYISQIDRDMAGVTLASLKLREMVKKPMAITSLSQLADILPAKIIKRLSEQQYSRAIYLPIAFENSLLGFFIIENSREIEALTTGDINLLEAVASQTALFISNISALDAIIQSEKTKTEFVTVASHEIRTPVQIVMLALEELKFGIMDNDRESVEKGIKALEESMSRLNIISKKMLDLSRIEKQKDQLFMELIETSTLAQYARAETDYLIEKYHHEIEYIIEPDAEHIYCDLNMMVQVITNLISNSAKYTPEGGKLATVISKTKSGMEIWVLDNGIGIPVEEHEKVFLKFYQIESTPTMPDSGYGLGLSFCREVIKQHGGYISIESPLSKELYEVLGGRAKDWQRPGCKVTVHLPSKNDV